MTTSYYLIWNVKKFFVVCYIMKNFLIEMFNQWTTDNFLAKMFFFSVTTLRQLPVKNIVNCLSLIVQCFPCTWCEEATKARAPMRVLLTPAAKGQLISEWIYEIIVSPKMQTKNYKDFCPTKQTRIIAKKTAYNHQKSTKKSVTILVCLVVKKSGKFWVGILGETMIS